MADNTVYLGLTFTSQNIALAEITSTPAGKVVTKLGVVPAPMPFTLQMMEEDSNSTQFAEAVDALMVEKEISGQNTACAVNASMSLLKRFPVDKGLSRDELQEHIDWEIQNNLISSPQEYSFKVFSVPCFSGTELQEQVLLMIRKKVINYYKKIIAQTRLEIDLLDVNIFAAENCWIKNYNPKQLKVSALIDVGSEFTSVGIFYQDYFLGYQALPNTDKKAGPISSAISQKLKALVEESNWVPPEETVSNIFCYGELANEELIIELQKKLKGQVEFLNPFKSIPVVAEVETGEEYKSSPMLFVEPVGLAFRQV